MNRNALNRITSQSAHVGKLALSFTLSLWSALLIDSGALAQVNQINPLDTNQQMPTQGYPQQLPGGYQQAPQQQGFTDALGRMMNGQMNQSQQAMPQGPIMAPPISFVDINSGRFGKLEIDLEQAMFLDGGVDKMHLTARNLDLNQGQLKSLDVEVMGGHFQDFTFDQLTLSTQGDLNFDTGVLFNHRTLQFTSPAQAQVSATISQDSLNKFINSPRTLDRLSAQANKRASGMIADIMGGQAPAVGLTLQEGSVALQKANRVQVNLVTKVGVGQLALPIPVELNAKLGLKDGWVEMSDTNVIASGQQLPPNIAQMLVTKVNSLANWGKSSDDIQFSFTDLKVAPNKQFVLKGTAQVNRLRFGNLRTSMLR